MGSMEYYILIPLGSREKETVDSVFLLWWGMGHVGL